MLRPISRGSKLNAPRTQLVAKFDQAGGIWRIDFSTFVPQSGLQILRRIVLIIPNAWLQLDPTEVVDLVIDPRSSGSLARSTPLNFHPVSLDQFRIGEKVHSAIHDTRFERKVDCCLVVILEIGGYNEILILAIYLFSVVVEPDHVERLIKH
jgi:hypothetical protein